MSVYELNRDQLNQLNQDMVFEAIDCPSYGEIADAENFAAFQVNHIKSPALHMEGGEIFIQEGLPLNPPAENRKSRSHDPGSHPVQRCP